VRQPIRVFLLIEAAAFAAAALAHAGVLVPGYQHQQARIAESLTALVLLAALVLSWLRSAWARRAGIVAQGFALLGTLVGLFTIAVGVGPQSAPDVAYHLSILAVLVWGLAAAARAPAGDTRRHA
jgi:hypothetical protein